VAGEKILIIEDEQDIALLTATIMRDNGYRAIVAHDGVKGLDMALSEQPDLILLDLRLPKMSGMQVLHALRERQVSVLVVVVTAWKSEEMVIEALRLGVKDYLSKPFALEELLEVVERALTEERLRRERDTLTEQLLISNRELERRARNLMLVNRVSTTLTSLLDAHNILELTVQHVVEISGADYGSALILERDGQHGRIIAEHPSRKFADFRLSLPRSPSVQRALKLGFPYAFEDATAYPFLEDFQEQITSPGISSLLLTPLVARGELIGVLLLASLGRPRTFSDEEMEVCQTVAGQAAVAVANARLLQDVEQQKRALSRKTQELTKESSKLDAILSNIADGLVVTDPTGRIILSNPVFREMAGLPVDRSLRGFLLAGYFPVAGLQSLVSRALEDPGQVLTDSLELPGGQVLKASATAMCLRPTLLDPAQEEQIAGVATVLRDITHEVEVDRMKTDFISAVSHELRSPLTAILGFASLIRRDINRSLSPHVNSDEKAGRIIERTLESLTIIENESERLTRLVNDLLDIARMEAGQVKWRMDEIDLGRVIESAITVTSALAEEKGLSTRVYLPPDGLPLIYGHRDRLVQVMTNLLSNAIKFTGRGCIEVRGWRLDVDNGALHTAGPVPSVYADKKHPAADKKHPAADKKHPAREGATARSVLSDLQLSEGRWAVVSVADIGIGIPTEALSFIFEKFTQVGETLTEKPKGTGLGLAICKEIVERHGGRIWAESEEGAGSLFSFALPLPPGDSEEAEYLIEDEE